MLPTGLFTVVKTCSQRAGVKNSMRAALLRVPMRAAPGHKTAARRPVVNKFYD
jgi:hypothetical protein